MTSATEVAALDGPWLADGIRVTCLREADAELADRFWPLYEEAFGPMRVRAAARQVLTRQEFDDEVTNPRVWKYVAWDEAGEPVGLTTLTDDLAAVPWISPEYYAHRYPDHWERRAVFYLGFTLVKPALRHSRVLYAMLRPAVHRIASRRGVCAYDVCGFNDATLRFGLGLERLVHRFSEAEVSTVDVQTYYVASFSGVLKD